MRIGQAHEVLEPRHNGISTSDTKVESHNVLRVDGEPQARPRPGVDALPGCSRLLFNTVLNSNFVGRGPGQRPARCIQSLLQGAFPGNPRIRR